MRYRLTLLILIMFLVTACGGDDDSGSESQQAAVTPSAALTQIPTDIATESPAETPTQIPTLIPTALPTELPTDEPAQTPIPILATPMVDITPLAVNDSECETIIQQAYEQTRSVCETTGQDEACYGNTEVVAEPSTLNFNTAGDIVSLTDIVSLRLSSMNPDSQQWGISLLRIQATALDTNTLEPVELLLFGNVEVSPAQSDSPEFGPMQAFTFRSGINDHPCEAAPDSGILVQTPKGIGKIRLRVNEVTVDLGSTAYLQSQPGTEMRVSVVEGQADVTAQGQTVFTPAGSWTSIPVDSNNAASAPPSPPRPYTNARFQTLPVTLLSQTITVAPSLTRDDLVNVTGLGEVATLINVEGGILQAGIANEYVLNLTSGQNLFFDLLEDDMSGCCVYLTLEDADGNNVFDTSLGDHQNIIEMDGEYTLRLVGSDEDVTGTYSFQLWNVPAADAIPISIGDTIIPDAPDGAGHIETPGVTDIYTFYAESGSRIFLDALEEEMSGCCLYVKLLDSQGFKLEDTSFRDVSISIQTSGTHRLSFTAYTDHVGTYSFKLWNIPPDDTFDIAQGDTITPDSPQGAGHLETPGTADVYQFELTADQTIFLDTLDDEFSRCCTYLTLTDTNGNEILDSGLNDQQATALTTGLHTLRIYGYEDVVGTYSFKLWNVPAPQTFETALGDTIMPNSDGRGTLESPGAVDLYTFTISAPQTITITDVEADYSACCFYLAILDPDGNEIVDIGLYEYEAQLPAAGTYQLRLYGHADSVGTYTFTLR